MTTNEIKKGMRIALRCGWYGTMMDNLKGNTRLAEVEGIYKEMGSVYAHDIVSAMVGGKWVTVEHTERQKKLRAMVG